MGNRASVVSEADLVTVVAVGVTGSGKSTLCNLLAGQEISQVCEGFKSGTKTPAHVDVFRQRFSLRVVDTVGFLSNHAESECEESLWQWWFPFAAVDPPSLDQEETDKSKFEELTSVSIFGIDTFLFVERYGRFTEETSRHFKVFSDLVGPEALQHTVVVFTHVSSDRLSEALQDSDLPVGLRDIANQVHSIVGVECVKEPRKVAGVLLQTIQRVVEANAGRRYQSDQLAKMQEKRKDLATRIARLRRVDRREALKKQHMELVKGMRTYAELLRAIEDAEAAERALRETTDCWACRRLFSRFSSWPHWPWAFL